MRKRSTSAALPALLALIAALAAPGVASAAAAEDGAQAEARLRFKKGSKLYDEGNFREAAREFEAGYAILPRPGFLVNIGHSYRRSGDLKKARRYYEMFLAAPDSDAAQREEVKGHLAGIDEALADDADDDRPRGTLPAAPLSAPVPAPVPAVVIAAAPAVSATPPERREIPVTHKWWFWTALGGAVLAGATAGFLSARSHYGGSSPEVLCGTLGCVHE